MAVAVVIFVAASIAYGIMVVTGGPVRLLGLPENVYIVRLTEYEISPQPQLLFATVGQPIRLQLVNEGSVPHEFMITPDIEMMAEMIRERAAELQAQNLSEEEIAEILEELHEAMMERMMAQFRGVIEGPLMTELEPGERTVITLVFNEPGVYTVACFEIFGTTPKPHALLGMFNQIVVLGGES